MKLGQSVTISNYFQKNDKHVDAPAEIPENASEIEPNVFEFENYSPVKCDEIKGIITGYKQLSTKILYTISQDDIFKGSIEQSWSKEPVYVVNKSLTKKYFVKKEWISPLLKEVK